MKKKILLSTILAGTLLGTMSFSNFNYEKTDDTQFVENELKNNVKTNGKTTTSSYIGQFSEFEGMNTDLKNSGDKGPNGGDNYGGVVSFGEKTVDEVEEKNGQTFGTGKIDLNTEENGEFYYIDSVEIGDGDGDVFRTLEAKDYDKSSDPDYGTSKYFGNNKGVYYDSDVEVLENGDYTECDIKSGNELGTGNRDKLTFKSTGNKITSNGGTTDGVTLGTITETPNHYYNRGDKKSEGGEGSGYYGGIEMDFQGRLIQSGEEGFEHNDLLELRFRVRNISSTGRGNNKIKGFSTPKIKINGTAAVYYFDNSIWDENETYDSIIRKKKIGTEKNNYEELADLIFESIEVKSGRPMPKDDSITMKFYNETKDEVIYEYTFGHPSEEIPNLKSPDIFFQLTSSGIDTDVTPLTNTSGELNETGIFHISIPFIEDYGITQIGENFSEAGVKSSFVGKDSSDPSEDLNGTDFRLYLNNDFKIGFETEGGVKGVKGKLDYDENFTPTIIADFLPDNGELRQYWEVELGIPGGEAEENGGTVVIEDVPGVINDEGGYGIPLQSMDEAYPESDSLNDGEKGKKEMLFKQRGSFDIEPAYSMDSGEEVDNSEQQIGRIIEKDITFTTLGQKSFENSTPTDTTYDMASGEIQEYNLNLIFDSTPMLDKLVNENEELFYSSEDTYEEANPGDYFNNFHSPSGVYEVTLEDGETIETIEISNSFDYDSNTDEYGNVGIGEGVFDEDNGDEDPTHGVGSGDDPRTLDIDESGDDTPAGGISGGDVEPVYYEHVITSDNQNEPTFEDVYFVEIGEGNLPAFLGEDLEDGETTKRGGLDYEYLIESNPFIQEVEYGDGEYEGEGDVENNGYKKGFVKRTVTINPGSETLPTKTFETVIAEELDESVKRLALEGREDYFRDGDGTDLIYNMQQRGLIKVPSDYDPEETSIDQLMVSFGVSELDGESTKVQGEAMRDSRDINEGLEGYDFEEEYDEIEFIDGKTNEEVIQGLGFGLTLANNYNFKPGNHIDYDQEREIKELIDKVMPKTIYNDEIVNRNEGKVEYGGLYEVSDSDGGYSGIQLVDDETQPSGFRIVVEDGDKIKDGSIEIDKSEPGTKKSSIQNSTFHYEDGVKKKGRLTVVRFNVEHQVTRHSTLVGEGEIYIPLFVTEKTVKSIQQYDQDKIDNFKRELQHLFDIYGKPDLGYGEDYVNPKDREKFEGGDVNYGYGQPGDLVNKYHGDDEFYGDAEKYGNGKDEDGNGTGYGDDPTTEIDESIDDNYDPFELTRKDYLNFIYEQNEGSDDFNEETGEYEIHKTTNAFSGLVFQISQFSEYDIEVEFQINGKSVSQLNSRELLLKDDELKVIIKPKEDSSQSRGVVQGRAEYTFGVGVPEGIELPDVQPPLDKEELKETKISLIAIIIIITFIILIVVGTFIGFKKRKSNKVLIE